MNQFIEIQEKERWQRGVSEDGMSVEEITQIAKLGLGRCPEECFSRDISGDDACACVRSIFPTPQHYEVYLEARAFFLSALAKGAFAALVGDAMEKTTKDE